MKRKNLEPGALTAPLPPVMVTVGNKEEANVLTIAWTGILATVPPKTYISVRPSRHSFGILERTREFVINLPTVSQARTVDYVGIYTGAKQNKIERCGISLTESNKVSAPTIEECPIALECKVTDILPMGSHHVFIADIVSVSVREGLIDESGKIHFERADLLAYAHGEYYSLGDVVGRFGFSTDKQRSSSASAQRREKASVAVKKSPPATEKRASVDSKKTTDGEKDKSRPFYLDLPRSVRKKSGGKKGSKK